MYKQLMKKSIILIVILLSALFLCPESKKEENDNHKIGINAKVSYSYYRRGYAFMIDVLTPINIKAGFYIEPGMFCIGYMNSNSHFFAVVNDIYNIKNQGILFGVKTNFRYRFQLIDNFGISIGNGLSFGPEFVTAFSYVDLVDYFFVNFTLIPDIFVGTYINYKNFRFDISCTKQFPLIVFFYNAPESRWYTIGNYNDTKIFNPIRVVCVSAFSIDFGFTYFFK